MSDASTRAGGGRQRPTSQVGHGSAAADSRSDVDPGEARNGGEQPLPAPFGGNHDARRLALDRPRRLAQDQSTSDRPGEHAARIPRGGSRASTHAPHADHHSDTHDDTNSR